MADAAGESASAAALPPATNRGGWLRAWSIPRSSTSSDLSLKDVRLLNRRRRFCLSSAATNLISFAKASWHKLTNLGGERQDRPDPPML